MRLAALDRAQVALDDALVAQGPKLLQLAAPYPLAGGGKRLQYRLRRKLPVLDDELPDMLARRVAVGL